MTSTDCQHVRLNLGSFVDGELSGAEMMPVSQHLASCANCAGEAERIQSIGQWLRQASTTVPEPRSVDALAASVVSRLRAEESQSWSSRVSRGFGDWHWALVGAGSLAAAFVSILFVSMLLHFGPAPQREDSLSAILMNLTSRPGEFYMRVTEPGNEHGSMVVQVENGFAATSDQMSTIPSGFAVHADKDPVQELLSLLGGTNAGKPIDVASMSRKEQEQVGELVAEIRRLKFGERGLGPLEVQLWLVARTSVSANAL